MISHRHAADRGHTRLDWLDSRHSFSFGSYHDPDHLGFGVLRVINDDRVAPGGGFGTHGHRDMEIITYVLEGALRHADSSGGGGIIRPGNIQLMRAGSGITHSEYNASDTEPVHFLQIWIEPAVRGLPPGYQEASVPTVREVGVLHRLVAQQHAPVEIAQDAALHAGRLPQGTVIEQALDADRRYWLQIADGAVGVRAGTQTGDAVTGDGVAISGERVLELKATDDSEVLLFDLA